MTNFNRIAEAAEKSEMVEFGVDQFIQECCFVDTGSKEIGTSTICLYNAYQRFAQSHDLAVAGLMPFSIYMRECGINLSNAAGKRYFEGIRLRTDVKKFTAHDIACSLPTHSVYDNKKVFCPGSCRNQKRERISVGTKSGISKSTQVSEATKQVGRALVNLASALREYVSWYMFN